MSGDECCPDHAREASLLFPWRVDSPAASVGQIVRKYHDGSGNESNLCYMHVKVLIHIFIYIHSADSPVCSRHGHQLRLGHVLPPQTCGIVLRWSWQFGKPPVSSDLLRQNAPASQNTFSITVYP